MALPETSPLRGEKAAELRARVCNREDGGVCCQDHDEDYQDQINFLSLDYQVEEEEAKTGRLTSFTGRYNPCPR